MQAVGRANGAFEERYETNPFNRPRLTVSIGRVLGVPAAPPNQVKTIHQIGDRSSNYCIFRSRRPSRGAPRPEHPALGT